MAQNKSNAIDAADIVMGISLLAEREFANHGLSRRQCQIAFGLFQGDSGKLIAKRLYLTTSCIRYHITIIYKKTKSKNREDFLHTIWRGINASKTSWKNKAEMQRDRDAHLAKVRDWARC